MPLKTKRHVIDFTPLDIRVSPGFLVRKCGMVLYINLKQHRNVDLICHKVTSQEVPLYGGEAAHVFTSVNDRLKGEMHALLHFKNNGEYILQIIGMHG